MLLNFYLFFKLRLDTNVNSLDMQLGEFTYMTSKQVITIQVVKDRNNRSGSTRRHEDDSRSSFLVKGSTSTLEGCGTTKVNQRHKGLTLFSDEPRHKGLVHAPLSGALGGSTTPLHKEWGTHPQLNWRLPTPTTKLLQHKASFGGDFSQS